MAKRRLVWTLAPIYFVIILLAVLLIGLYSNAALSDYHARRTASDMQVRLRLLVDLVPPSFPLTPPDSLQSFCRYSSATSRLRLTLVSADGRVLADSDRETALLQDDSLGIRPKDIRDLESLTFRPEVRDALAGKLGLANRRSQILNSDVLFVAAPITRSGIVRGVLRAAVPLAEQGPDIERFRVILALALMVALGLATLITAVLTRLVDRPISAMQHGAERFAAGDFSHKVAIPATAELGALADALNRMADQLGDKIRAITLQRNEQEAILASLQESVLALDARERVLYANRAAVELLNIDQQKMVGRSLPEVARSSTLHQFISKILAGTQAGEGEVTLEFGDERVLQVSGTPLRDASGTTQGVLVVINDVTRLRKLENLRRDFVANVSHELKTPITTIQGFVETLLEGALDEPERAKDFLSRIEQNTLRLNAIIDDLLSLSRIEQEGDRGSLKRAVGSLGGIVAAAISNLAYKANELDISIELRCPVDVNAAVNSLLLEQAVSNLLDNAIKYSETGKTVVVEVARQGQHAMITVEDFGVGIPADHLPRIFERFYRVDKARSRHLGGTGLGLAIVKHIVQAHGGQVTVESTSGSGSKFTIQLIAI